MRKEDRKTPGWLTIIEPLSGWADGAPDYILAYRRGGGIFPTLYDGHMNAVVEFPSEGYAVHADLWGSHTEQVIIYSSETASIYSSMPADLSEIPSGIPLSQPKRLSCSTLYPGGRFPSYLIKLTHKDSLVINVLSKKCGNLFEIRHFRG